MRDCVPIGAAGKKFLIFCRSTGVFFFYLAGVGGDMSPVSPP